MIRNTLKRIGLKGEKDKSISMVKPEDGFIVFTRMNTYLIKATVPGVGWKHIPGMSFTKSTENKTFIVCAINLAEALSTLNAEYFELKDVVVDELIDVEFFPKTKTFLHP